MTLTVEYTEEEVVLACDCEGLRRLVEALEKLGTHTPPWHTHLMTPSWGGDGLTEEPQLPSATLVHHFRLQLIGG